MRSVSSFFRYLKTHSQQALSSGYPFFEKDFTTSRESGSCRNAVITIFEAGNAAGPHKTFSYYCAGSAGMRPDLRKKDSFDWYKYIIETNGEEFLS